MRTIIIDNFVTDGECDYLITLAETKVKRSLVVSSLGEEVEDDWRTSSHTFLEKAQDGIVREIEMRMSKIAGKPEENGEGLQILKYKVGEEYKPHYDFFDPAVIGNAEILKRGGQRETTILLYLNNPEEGGETELPGLNLVVKPQKGKLFLFDNTTDGKIDYNSLHSSIPVKKGVKWVATKWFRENEFI